MSSGSRKVCGKAVILRAMSEALGIDELDLSVGDWERFFDRVVLEIRKDEYFNATSNSGQASISFY